MTKPIVSVAVMMLIEEGKLDISAPVSQYLPEFKDLKVGIEKRDAATGNTELVLEPVKKPMTVHDLLRHTAGLVYGLFGDGLVHKAYREAKVGDRSETNAELITKRSKLPLAHQPGEVWEYSVATDVLGRIIEVISGMASDAFIEERITKPLGMNSTGFYVREPDAGRLAQPQIDPATKERPSMFDPTKKPNWLSGGGALVSTAGDYLRFADMVLNRGAQGGIRHLAAGQGFGLGFAVRTSEGQNSLPGSVGTHYWTGAFGTTFWIDPLENLVGIMMVQVPLAKTAAYRRAMRYLTYQALRAG
jgi:CubicO group peptidase (beta-lactamase class C family)